MKKKRTIVAAFIVILLLVSVVSLRGKTATEWMEFGRSSDSMTIAAVCYGMATIVDPECVDAHVEMSKILYYCSLYGRAINQISIAIELEPFNPLHYLNRANYFIYERDYEGAIADSETAMKMLDDDCFLMATALYLRGVALCMTGDHEKGIKDMTEAIKRGNKRRYERYYGKYCYDSLLATLHLERALFATEAGIDLRDYPEW